MGAAQHNLLILQQHFVVSHRLPRGYNLCSNEQ